MPISAIILTYNEEENLEECLRSLYEWVEDIFIVDSYSKDKTLDVAKKYTDKIYQHAFENQAKQVNWALRYLPIKTEWIIRLDADERVISELRNELLDTLPGLNRDITGLYVKRRVYFMGRWMRNGGYYPTWLLRIWRKGKGHYEERWMDEHVKITEGRSAFLKGDIVEENKKNLHWWTEKHNGYATREAIDMLNIKHQFLNYEKIPAKLGGTQEHRKRWLKEKAYARMPLFVRPFLYFFYRYFLRLGFVDGREGLIWHFLQGFWYRFLVDAKIFEIQKKVRIENKDMREVICELFELNMSQK